MNTQNFIKSIIYIPLDKSQYFQEKYDKRQIVLHHTVSNGNAKNVINWWKTDKKRIATAFVIDGEGIIHQAFNSAYWGHHLGTKEVNNTILNKQSIGIEICSWGPLTKKGDKFFSFTGKEIPLQEVIFYKDKFRGNHYYHKYNDKQLETLKNLIIYLSEKYKIPAHYKSDMWDISRSAVSGSPGIYTHVSFRKDKSDCHPQLELIKLLKDL